MIGYWFSLVIFAVATPVFLIAGTNGLVSGKLAMANYGFRKVYYGTEARIYSLLSIGVGSYFFYQFWLLAHGQTRSLIVGILVAFASVFFLLIKNKSK